MVEKGGKKGTVVGGSMGCKAAQHKGAAVKDTSFYENWEKERLEG